MDKNESVEMAVFLCQSCQSLTRGAVKQGEAEHGICQLCCGVCERIKQVADQAVQNLESCGFEFDNVSLQIKLAPFITLQDGLLKYKTKSNWGEIDTFIKDMLRGEFEKALAEKFPNVHNCFDADARGLVVDVSIDNSKSAVEAAVRVGCKPEQSAKQKRKSMPVLTMLSVNKYLKQLTGETTLLPTPKETCDIVVNYMRGKSIFVTGSYQKFVRSFTHSPWAIGGVTKGAGSVEGSIAPALATKFNAETYKFHSAGREDMDVRMLGTGRPFAVELVNAKVYLEKDAVKEVEKQINNAPGENVCVTNLDIAGKDCLVSLDSGANSKKKQYTCVIWVQKTIKPADLQILEDVNDMNVNQQCPIRVIHRRSAIMREKKVYSCSCEYLNSHFFILRLVASAGTYIKEFVHGDFGRTDPSVASLLECDAEIIQLDVEKLIFDNE
uniref:tRNA pseudouridine(55) synthase n=1 Tax=Mucochytrium quahogii TaxID=96639 RepID=A0A7S2SQE3_9STRA|mmetsp:Transcript_6923/g.10958  ORF Transcript_6923/g.10958 Transcript_6923/m.10958 type:complete len:440 (-) Transcript_6923:718-2037(-)|eukprot:CAMPEP_0203756390 /NCGR_PEP_ID=MMETSP0098-20131031/9694_1 /ASSEMBLY_ACC=CAM_ASM_000208 /TAXON_ID=96639 /ORGANISM=" , Strain NY0313808BC1" /LENGTH=439 /DNA_ID=CAMNT_0050648263 /DNA_START=848 /DNA_END=2167 /DNA_ORIENTATION=-